MRAYQSSEAHLDPKHSDFIEKIADEYDLPTNLGLMVL